MNSLTVPRRTVAFISVSARPLFESSVRNDLYTAEGPQDMTWDKYRILLVALSPSPQPGIVIGKLAYVATLRISLVPVTESV